MGLSGRSGNGEILDAPADPKRHRAQRFALKSVVNRLLPTSRTSKCCRWRVPKQALQVHRSIEHGKAFFSGLQVCASVWACPVCAAKISERRRAELVTAVALAKSMGMHVKLLTLTVPHGLGDDLPTLLVQIRNAWRRTTTGRAGKDFRKLLGIKGTIRALEVTHGQNGFHPHLHVLLFLEQDATNGCIQGLFTPIWQDACTKAGLPRPSDAHGCRVDDGSKAAAYASKWGLESEMTKSHTKQGRKRLAHALGLPEGLPGAFRGVGTVRAPVPHLRRRVQGPASALLVERSPGIARPG